MSGASSATARSEPIPRRCGSEVMPPILPIPEPARHRKTALTIRYKRVAGSHVRNPPKLTLVRHEDLVGVLIEFPHNDPSRRGLRQYAPGARVRQRIRRAVPP